MSAKARDLTRGPVAIIGYCMGGLLALALALAPPRRYRRLALLATPWDFHAERAGAGAIARRTGRSSCRDFSPRREPFPVSVIQFLFLMLDPFLAERKFIRFAALDPKGPAARGFVALEDWINDGVPLARNVARRMRCNPGTATTTRRAVPGRSPGSRCAPEDLAAPTLVVLPRRDRIVPPRSAEPLATAIPGLRCCAQPSAISA